jgi:hypothetical protein
MARQLQRTPTNEATAFTLQRRKSPMHNQTVNEKLARGVAWTATLAAATLIVAVAAFGAKHFGEGRSTRASKGTIDSRRQEHGYFKHNHKEE